MRRIGQVIVVLLGALAGSILTWRFLANRQTMPCPAWLSFLLENRWMERVASAEGLMERAGVEPGMRLLDIGCGPGRISVPAARWVGAEGKVLALDIQPEMLRRARQRAKSAGVENIEFLEGRAGSGLLPLGSFDRAFLVTVLGEIPNRLETLKEIYLALKPGGLLSVTEVFPDPHFQAPNSVRYLAYEAGFEPAGYFSQGLAYTIHFRKPAVLA